VSKALSFLFGAGWWTLWYWVLWGAATPAIVLLIWYLRSSASAGEHPGAASTAQAFGMILYALVIPVSALLWTLSRRSAGWVKYLQGIGLFLPIWLVGQYFIWHHWYFIDTLTLPRAERVRHILGMAATVLMLHLFNLYATWRFRMR
jgi:hypothetical protein